MERIAKFEFVSKEQFVHDWIDTFGRRLRRLFIRI